MKNLSKKSSRGLPALLRWKNLQRGRLINIYCQGSGQRGAASRLAAKRASGSLARQGWSEERIARVCHAIEAHSFSAGIAPGSLEARILQDADRLDAIGMIGVARCFYVAGARGAAIHAVEDPEAMDRPLDELSFAADHFRTKLLGLGAGFQTATGRQRAQSRMRDLRYNYDRLMREVGGEAPF